MAFQQVTRAEARNILAVLVRGQNTRINGEFITFNRHGNFVGRHGPHDVFCTPSLKQCLNYLFGEQND